MATESGARSMNASRHDLSHLLSSGRARCQVHWNSVSASSR
jgi:hypothetical protein